MIDTDMDVMAVGRRLRWAIDALDQAAADVLGVGRDDFRALILLEPGPMAPARVGPALGLTPRKGAEMLLRLERQGCVERSRDPGDRRGVVVSASPAVFTGVGGLYRACADNLRAAVAAYPPLEREMAVRHLTDAAAAVEAATDDFAAA